MTQPLDENLKGLVDVLVDVLMRQLVGEQAEEAEQEQGTETPND